MMQRETRATDDSTLRKRADALFDTGRLQEATGLYKVLLEKSPTNDSLVARLGDIALREGHYRVGADLLQRALVLKPDQVPVLMRLGFALMNLEDLHGALVNYDRALVLAPEVAGAHFDRSILLMRLGRYAEALAGLDHSIALRPDYAGAYYSRGMLLWQLKRFDESLASYDQAIAINPNFAGAHAAKAELLLLMGDYLRGWPMYRWRWKTSIKKANRLFSDHPIWSGEQSVVGKTVLIHPEFGFGDYLMLVRYAPLLKQLGARVVICAQPALVRLFSQLDDEFVVVEKRKALPPFDFQCPIMSLPAGFRTTLESLPSATPYLKVAAQAGQEWRARLGAAERLRVGLVWSGQRLRNIDSIPIRARSMPLQMLEALLELPCEFHCLQKEVSDTDRERLRKFSQVHLHHTKLNDFSDTAGLIDQMDLVISIDTAVAHLAGALGKPLWMMLPYASDYRWMIEGETTPWYPSAKLFRQPTPAQWQPVVDRIRGALESLVLPR